jgi:PIN domain nuclease of toxin-antitoxin system
MLTICDTNILLFWADQQERLTVAAKQALETGRNHNQLACVDISFWEIAMLFRKNRLVLPAQQTPTSYMEDIVESLGLTVLSLTPAIAALTESGIVAHGDVGVGSRGVDVGDDAGVLAPRTELNPAYSP